MRKVSIAIAVFVWANFCLLSVLAAGVTISSLTASIDPSNKLITVSGIISSGAGRQVSIRVIDPNGYNDFLYQTVSRTNGYFNFSYTTGNTTMGIYTVKVGGYGMLTPAKTTFVYKDTVTSSPAKTPTASPTKTEIIATMSATPTPISTLVKPMPTATPILIVAPVPTVTPTVLPATSINLPPPANPPVVSIPNGGNNVVSTTSPTVLPTPEKTPVVEPMVKIPDIGSFTDIKGHWSFNYIKVLLEKGILAGYSDGTIRPDTEITRLETVAIVVRATGIKPARNVSLDFSDKNDIPAWARGYVQVASEKGIVAGYPDKTFRPNKKISRAEMIAIVNNAFNLGKSTNTIHDFADAKKIQPWVKGYIARAYELGLIKGYKDNTFKPDNNITRGEVFVVITNSINLKKLNK